MSSCSFLGSILSAAVLEITGQGASAIAFNWWLRADTVNNLSVVIISDAFYVVFFGIISLILLARLVGKWNDALEERYEKGNSATNNNNDNNLRSSSATRVSMGAATSISMRTKKDSPRVMNGEKEPLVSENDDDDGDQQQQIQEDGAVVVRNMSSIQQRNTNNDEHDQETVMTNSNSSGNDTKKKSDVRLTFSEIWFILKYHFFPDQVIVGWLVLAGLADTILSLCETYSAGQIAVLTQLFIKAGEPILVWIFALKWRKSEHLGRSSSSKSGGGVGASGDHKNSGSIFSSIPTKRLVLSGVSLFFVACGIALHFALKIKADIDKGSSDKAESKNPVGFILMYVAAVVFSALYAIAYGRYIFLVRRLACHIDPLDVVDLRRGFSYDRITIGADGVVDGLPEHLRKFHESSILRASRRIRSSEKLSSSKNKNKKKSCSGTTQGRHDRTASSGSHHRTNSGKININDSDSTAPPASTANTSVLSASDLGETTGSPVKPHHQQFHRHRFHNESSSSFDNNNNSDNNNIPSQSFADDNIQQYDADEGAYYKRGSVLSDDAVRRQRQYQYQQYNTSHHEDGDDDDDNQQQQHDYDFDNQNRENSHQSTHQNENELPQDNDDDEEETSIAILERNKCSYGASATEVRVVACTLEVTIAFVLSMFVSPCLELLPGGVGQAKSWSDLLSQTNDGIKALSAPSTMIFAVVTLAGWAFVYAADSVLNHLSAPLTSLINQLASPLTAILLLIVPALDASSTPESKKHPEVSLGVQLAMKIGSCVMVFIGSVLMYFSERYYAD